MFADKRERHLREREAAKARENTDTMTSTRGKMGLLRI